MSKVVRSHTYARLLARSVGWNFLGLAAPLVVALYAIPLLIDGLGKERFGLLTIIWISVGYFSLFDLGMGRALTKLVAEQLGKDATEDIGPLIWSALILLAFMGLVGGVLVLVFSEPIVVHLLNVEPELHAEAIAMFRMLAIGLPIVIVTAALVGVLQGYQRFGVIALIRIPLGVLTFAGPLISLQFTPSLTWATAALLLSRTLALLVYFIVARNVLAALRVPSLPRRHHVQALLTYGGWLTVTNIVGPLMTYMDRFFVAAILNMTAVTYYVTPYEILSRLKVLPQSIVGVVFPAMSTAHASGRGRLVLLYAATTRLLAFTMLPLTAAVFLLAPEALDLWLGEDFRKASTPVLQLLAVGWMVNILAHPSLTLLQSVGRPDLVAKVHLAELLPYLLMLWILTLNFGIVGSAAAWSLRVLVDTVVLNELAGKGIPELRRQVIAIRISIPAILAGFSIAWLMESLFARSMVLLLVIFGALWALLPMATYLKNDRSDKLISTKSASA